MRIEADTYDEYRRRVEFLYSVLRKNGMSVDTQNKNPSRLSRMPGITRNGHKQFLLDTNIGKGSWDEWREWIDANTDDLPDPESLDDVWDDLPELSPPLISGILRQGHKMLLAGPSKAGKSFALIELSIAIAEGRDWLGFSCAQGRVLYVNLELDRASCLHRLKDVYIALGVPPENRRNIDVWNLRGHSVPMDKLAPKLIRRAAKKNYLAIIIDPIYKVITGDENSADQMAAFCNQFDRVCTELGASVIYCHHHSKGLQGQKRSMDRASGSGVFARDPDALLDLIELEVPKSVYSAEEDRAEIEACRAALDKNAWHWQDYIGQDAENSVYQMRETARKYLSTPRYAELEREISEARAAVQSRTAWRIEGTLREFPRFQPLNLWFDYPRHFQDTAGILDDLDAEGEKPAWKKGAEKNKANVEKRRSSKEQDFKNALLAANAGDPPTVKDMAEYLGVAERTVRDRVRDFGYRIDRSKGNIIVKAASSVSGGE